MQSSTFRQIVWPFAVAQTIIWASIYYSFPALLLEFERDLGWNRTELSGALTLALLTSALLAPLAGRLIDHGHGKIVLTGSAFLASLLLMMLSMITTKVQFYLVWVALGACMSGALYEACFAFLTKHMGDNNKRAITRVALVAGLAGTVAFPTAYWLASQWGWRGAIQVYAAAVFLITVPLTLFATRQAEQHHEKHRVASQGKHLPVARILRSAPFLMLSGAFAIAALNHGMMITHLLPILSERGISPPHAVLAAASIGPMQVFGRILMTLAGDRLSNKMAGFTCFAAMLVASVSLYFATGSGALVALFVILQGAGWGTMSIIKPVMTAEFLGKGNFGVVSGFMTLPVMAGFALSPSLASMLWSRGGYDLVILAAFVFAALGLVLLAAAANAVNSKLNG